MAGTTQYVVTWTMIGGPRNVYILETGKPTAGGNHFCPTFAPQVVSGQDSASMEAVRVLRVQAAEAWKRPGHPGWSLVREPLELMGNASGGASRMGSDALEQMAVQMFIKAEAAGGGYGASTGAWHDGGGWPTSTHT